MDSQANSEVSKTTDNPSGGLVDDVAKNKEGVAASPVASHDEKADKESQETSKDSSKELSPAEKQKKKKKYFLIVIVAIVIGAICGAIWWLWAQGHEDTDDSYIDGHISTISTRVAGTVTAVFVDDNQRVAINQKLVLLDGRDYQTKVDELRASLAQALKQNNATQKKVIQSQLSGEGQLAQASAESKSALAETEKAEAAYLAAQDDVHKSQAKVREQAAQLEFAKTDFERYRLTYAEEAVTKQQYDHAKENINVAKAQLDGAKNDLQQSQEKVLQAAADVHDAEAHQLRSKAQTTSAVASNKQQGIDESQHQSQVQTSAMAKAQLDAALLRLSYCNINAPVAGRIGRKNVEVGQSVQVGQSLMAIVQDDMWVTANFKETQLTKMRIGQKAEIRIDSFPGKVFLGKIISLSPASGAKFSVLPPDNATGNFTKVVQRLPVKIEFDRKTQGDYAQRISPGMSCVTTIDF